MTGFNPTLAALFGSIATAAAIFAGGLAVESYKRDRDRAGMALALAGAIDALLSLIATREMIQELMESLEPLDAGQHVTFGSIIGENAAFKTMTLAYADRIGHLGHDLPFRVARFLAYTEGLLHDLARLNQNGDKPQVQAMLIRRMKPVWLQTETLGKGLVLDLKREGASRSRRPAKN
ncbi:hypothetical protein HN018_19355 [Lichenicola cladoniae]|uniref:Uncharacterized protein n=1 Tax=Lichenicola cladoniae TaxID=1484109 RepID=A0A6M8HU85_9PROT|nr:hypothetical protein [Lichenicola cladoniae]NPD70364.1 hypothetical protein [Acetobacteraceae bacterium]QKE91902.1 hypothetical protein HN018_19355 [Lichenicola cladoniae]